MYFDIKMDDTRFDFDKINLITLTVKGRMADKYRCSKSGLVGYRFGVRAEISVSKTVSNLKKHDKYLQSLNQDNGNERHRN